MRTKRREAGFVLVMVLLVLLIAGTVMASAARRSCESAVSSGRAQRELQVRWGAESCQDFFLRNSEKVLRAAGVDSRGARVSATRTVMLGGMPFRVTVADEDAKANANVLLKRKGTIGLEVSLRNLQRDLAKAMLVRPEGLVGASYSSLDSLFAFESPAEFFDEEGKSKLLDRVTCWGSGKLNFKRAEVAVMRESLDGILTGTQVEELAHCRDRAPDCTLAEALAKLQLTKTEVEMLLTVLSDTSSCHSAWVTAEGKTRSWHRLYVVDGQKVEKKTPRRVFLW